MLARLRSAFASTARARLGALLFAGFASACAPKPAVEPIPERPPVAEPAPSPTPEPTPAGDGQCKVDADCVPAGCCHPATCVPVAQKPDCTDVMCTMQCAPNTLDCGGHCACEAGSCKAIFASP
jgi:hypothetical protein